MSTRETLVLPGLLALQLNYISKEQLAAALAAWSEAPQRDLADLLTERRFISEAQREALAGLVSAHLARITGRGLPPDLRADARETTETVVMSHTPQAPPPAAEPPPSLPGERFRIGSEIGRGGLARVVEATDSEIGRTVALKLMLEDAPGDALERFRYEARVTGRLEHPNIVPVHEVGVLPGAKEIFFCMKRIYGRDMHQVIREGGWKQRRLVEALRDVCHAVAYAHSKGVIHRDLKPANVMLGDFGEVLVVDWGLAVVKGAAPRGKGRGRAVAGSGGEGLVPPITEDGEILGTPAYMPPEQARGERDEVDERSDVYALGAMLYEILTERPPYEGRTPQEVVKKVVQAPLLPPSARAVSPPPELEAICLKAMARRKEDRYGSAQELAGDLEAYLEGTKERERREALASEQLVKARAAVERWKRLTREAAEAAREADKLEQDIPKHESLEKKQVLWRMEDRARGLERDSISAFTEADAALTSALSNVPGHRAAREMKAELHWARFLEAEAGADERGMQLARQTAEQFNDGILDARLRGDGTLEVTTRAYRCRCLVHGRVVRAEELGVFGLHPWTGRDLGGGADALQEAELPEGTHLKLHGAGCEPRGLAGAQVWAWRYEEHDRVLVPVTPHAGTAPCPAGALDALFSSSPYRPRGTGIYLGRTPVARQPWPMGSWLLVFVAEGRAPQRVPALVGRQQDVRLDVTLWEPAEVPTGFVGIAEGFFRFGDPTSISPRPVEIVSTPDYFFSRDPVTCRDYAVFLNELHRTAPEEAARRVPRSSDRSGYCWPLTPEGYVVPTAAWLASAPAELKDRSSRLVNTLTDWEELWPVAGVSWEDACAYARWLSFRTGRCLHLPHERQWEKAARGADGRLHPWGNHFDALRANTGQSRRGAHHPDPVDDWPSDESPWGVRGLTGNTSDRCLNEPEDSSGRRITRGGNWTRSGPMVRATYRTGAEPANVNLAIGFRLAAQVGVAAPSKD